MNDTIAQKVSTLVNEMKAAEHEVASAERRLKAAKEAIKTFSEATGLTALESDSAKVAVFVVADGTYLDPAKVKARFGDDGYRSCLSNKAVYMGIRLTLKK